MLGGKNEGKNGGMIIGREREKMNKEEYTLVCDNKYTTMDECEG